MTLNMMHINCACISSAAVNLSRVLRIPVSALFATRALTMAAQAGCSCSSYGAGNVPHGKRLQEICGLGSVGDRSWTAAGGAMHSLSGVYRHAATMAFVCELQRRSDAQRQLISCAGQWQSAGYTRVGARSCQPGLAAVFSAAAPSASAGACRLISSGKAFSASSLKRSHERNRPCA